MIIPLYNVLWKRIIKEHDQGLELTKQGFCQILWMIFRASIVPRTWFCQIFVHRKKKGNKRIFINHVEIYLSLNKFHNKLLLFKILRFFFLQGHRAVNKHSLCTNHLESQLLMQTLKLNLQIWSIYLSISLSIYLFGQLTFSEMAIPTIKQRWYESYWGGCGTLNLYQILWNTHPSRVSSRHWLIRANLLCSLLHTRVSRSLKCEALEWSSFRPQLHHIQKAHIQLVKI